MNIVLGTTSTQKKTFFEQTVQEKLFIGDLQTAEVDSGVSELPLSLEETILGATNQAKHAMAMQPKAEWAVGMDDGLENIGGIYNLVCAVTFWDGEKLIVGQSGHLPLPKVVSDKFKSGYSLDVLLKEYQQTASPEEEERIKQLITRELSYTSATLDAVRQLKISSGNKIAATSFNLSKLHELAITILQLSAILSGLYFSFGTILIFVSRVMMKPEVHYAMHIYMFLILLLGLASFSLFYISNSTHVKRMSSYSFTIMAGFFLVMVIITLLLLGIMQPMKTDLNWQPSPILMPALNLIGLLVLGVFGFWLSKLGKTSKPSMTTVAYLWVGAMGIIADLLFFVGYKGFSLLTSPLLLIGLFWSVGLWRFAEELAGQTQTKPTTVSAFYKMDKA